MRARARAASVLAALLVSCASRAALADSGDTREEFWPEVGAYVRLSESSRIYLLGAYTSVKENSYSEGQFGVHFDWFTGRPRFLPRLGTHAKTEDEAKRILMLRVGYRYGTSLIDSSDPFEEHRALGEATLRARPIGLLVSNRIRADLRWVNEERSQRYRDRLKAEKVLRLGDYHPVLYGSAEIYYDTRYDEFNRYRLIAGAVLPLPLKSEVDIYAASQHDRQAETQHVLALGTALSFYF